MKKLRDDLAKLPLLLRRWRLPLLILLAGVALMLWPTGGEKQPEQAQPLPSAAEDSEDAAERYRAQTEQRLEELLSQVEGAGRVRVMLTLEAGPVTRYQTELSQSASSEGERRTESREEKTLILNRGSAYNEAAVVTTVYPSFQGALVVAEGGGDPRVCYQLTAAVSALLQLGTDQITVVKMKEWGN